MFAFDFEEATGIMRITIVGAWTLPEIERYAREAGPQFATARSKAGALRLLLDNTRGALMPPDLVEPMLRAAKSIGRRDDRVAMVVASSLVKVQTRNVFANQAWGLFISEGAARIWLQAHDQALRIAS